jgi:hypothetical protein
MDWDCKDTEYFLKCNFLRENFCRIFAVEGNIGRKAGAGLAAGRRKIGRKAENGIGRKAA